MDYLHAVYLAVVQGVSEFLPVSSYGHLVLFPRLFGWPDQGLAFDIAVHVGSLVAVVSYFRRDVLKLCRGALAPLRGREQSPHGRLAWSVAAATIPAVLAGLAFGDFIEARLRQPQVIAATTVVFGLLMWWADARGLRRRGLETVGWRDAVFIGCAQALALIPGTSRSGITITAGLAMGLSRPAAARFSFLMAIPVILLAGGWQLLKLPASESTPDWGVLAAGALFAGLSAFVCIHLFLRMIERFSLFPFVVYRLLLGAWLFYLYA